MASAGLAEPADELARIGQIHGAQQHQSRQGGLPADIGPYTFERGEFGRLQSRLQTV